MPLIIGITGSIASGKSSACQFLESKGAVHCDADRLVHRMYDPGKPAFDRIVKVFGETVVDDHGVIDRKILGGKVFGKPKEMAKLTEAIGDIFAEVSGVMKRWRNSLAPHDIGLMEAVNFIEAGYGQFSDVTWLFAVDDNLAISRLMARNNLDQTAAEQRLASQQKWEDRAPAADIVTHNDGTMAELERKVELEINGIHSKHLAGILPTSKYMGWYKDKISQTNPTG
ncbi:dephospho-CoA kinase [SAR202 cluster bacterium AC-647-P02_OGT_505m]|nr:dephospho-CoA kinase [SAR202 cluster bacterium AC-647-P02_OGT_505m]